MHQPVHAKGQGERRTLAGTESPPADLRIHKVMSGKSSLAIGIRTRWPRKTTDLFSPLNRSDRVEPREPATPTLLGDGHH